MMKTIKRGRPKRSSDYQQYWDIIKTKKIIMEHIYANNIEPNETINRIKELYDILEKNYLTNKHYTETDIIMIKEYNQLINNIKTKSQIFTNS